jgi:hypothetical protein
VNLEFFLKKLQRIASLDKFGLQELDVVVVSAKFGAVSNMSYILRQRDIFFTVFGMVTVRV